jgi:hypothetical protein
VRLNLRDHLHSKNLVDGRLHQLRSDFIHMAGMTIHIALESTIHIAGIRSCSI